MNYLYLPLLLFLFACSCTSQKKETQTPYPTEGIFTTSITELSLEEYPDNPDVMINHPLSGTLSYDTLVIKAKNKKTDFVFVPANALSDTLVINDVELMEFLPSAPDWIKSDSFLTHVAIINQEWNRQQVKFTKGSFEIKGDNNTIKRVDIARNCLNAYLWEIIAYAEDSADLFKPCYHGWFNFPKDLYAGMFEARNGLPYKKYQKPLEDWVEIPNKKINFELLRNVVSSDSLIFESFNSSLYPLVGERLKKNKNIVCPTNAEDINDFLNDSTKFATFSVPGFYTTADPRATELSRFGSLQSVVLNRIVPRNEASDTLVELLLSLRRKNTNEEMKFTIGGLNFSLIDTLNLNTLHKGYQMPMGIANHSFYEPAEEIELNSTYENPYYALLTDSNGGFLDSHKVGIDGPLFWFDTTGKLHLMVLSFERHAFVGHYAFNI